MSVGLMRVDYECIGGGQEFCEWIADHFVMVEGKDHHFYITIEDFNKKEAKKGTKFHKENLEDIHDMRLAMIKNHGACEFCISW